MYNMVSNSPLVSFLPPVPPSEVQLRNGEILVKDAGIMTVTEDQVESVICVTRNSNPAPLITWMLGEWNIEEPLLTTQMLGSRMS